MGWPDNSVGRESVLDVSRVLKDGLSNRTHNNGFVFQIGRRGNERRDAEDMEVGKRREGKNWFVFSNSKPNAKTPRRQEKKCWDETMHFLNQKEG
jgi:hypothetical protein